MTQVQDAVLVPLELPEGHRGPSSLSRCLWVLSHPSSMSTARVRNGVSGKLLPLHFPTTLPDEFEAQKYLLTFAMWSSGVFTAQPENSPEQLEWKESRSCSSQAASCALL